MKKYILGFALGVIVATTTPTLDSAYVEKARFLGENF